MKPINCFIILFIMSIVFYSCKRSRKYGKDSDKEYYFTKDIGKNGDHHYQISEKTNLLSVKSVRNSEQTLKRIAYITSYNYSTNNPKWVSWHLIREHTDGPYTRKGVPYYSDDSSVYGIGRITAETCKNGYFVDMEIKEPRPRLEDWTREYNMSHGHMCPAGDNKWNKAAMNQSFLLTNMCPQDEKLNGGGWKKLEDKCRSWANRYGDIYIVAGPIFHKPITRYIGEGKIAVPDAFFKVILCINGIPKAIGFIYKNDSSSQSFKDCVMSIDDIEELTELDFFYSLSDEIENTVESESNLKEWN